MTGYRRSPTPMMALALFLALVVTLGPLQAQGATGRGSPGAGMGAPPGVVWRFATGGQPLLGAPVAGRDGTLYAAAANGVLYAVAPNGAVRWTLPSGAVSAGAATTRPAIGADGASYWNLQGGVVALDATGHVRWVFLAGPTSAPVLSQGRVLVVAGAYLYAIAATGSGAGPSGWAGRHGLCRRVRRLSLRYRPNRSAALGLPGRRAAPLQPCRGARRRGLPVQLR